MDLRFRTDPETGLPHVYDHGVQECEVEDVLENPGEVRRSRRGSRIAHGQTRAGRYLRVVYTLTPATGQVLVITAIRPVGTPNGVRDIIQYYDSLSEEEWLAEDEAAREAGLSDLPELYAELGPAPPEAESRAAG